MDNLNFSPSQLSATDSKSKSYKISQLHSPAGAARSPVSANRAMKQSQTNKKSSPSSNQKTQMRIVVPQ
jgi:hypothetical protein